MSDNKKKEMTKEDASRIQSKYDKGNVKKPKDGFKERAQSAGDKKDKPKGK
jgi:hypothetical protein